MTLTDLDAALAGLLDRLNPVASCRVALADAAGLIAAEDPAQTAALPGHTSARIDGWACHALDLIGASPMSPVPFSAPPAWVEAGDPLPDGCNAVLRPDEVQKNGPFHLAISEAIPAEGTIRPGEHLPGGSLLVQPGQRISIADILLAEAAMTHDLPCRIPRIHLMDINGQVGEGPSVRFVRAWLQGQGVQVETITSPGRTASDIAPLITAKGADLTVIIGGTGQGHKDETAAAIARAGQLVAHGIAFSSCQTACTGWHQDHPVIALPGAPESAFAGCLGLLTPVIARLSGQRETPLLHLPLLRKISSAVGLSELVLMQRGTDGWQPMTVGRLTLDQLRRADGWLIVPAGNEGYPSGTILGARPLVNGDR